MTWWQTMIIGGAVGYALHLLGAILECLRAVNRQLEFLIEQSHTDHLLR